MYTRNFLTLVVVFGFLFACIAVNGQDLEVDPGFTPIFTPERLNTVVFDQNGKMLVGGFFGQVNLTDGPKIIRLNDDGTTDTTFASPLYALGAGAADEVLTIKVLADGKILIGGYFPSIGPNVRIARLNANGTVDNTLTTKPTFINSGLVKAEPLANGQFLGCGQFQDANGVAKSGLARFNSDGALDGAYSTILTSNGSNTTCYDIKTLSDGKLLITGSFTAVNGVAKVGGARLNSDGTLDVSYTVQSPGTRIFTGANDQLLFSYSYNYMEPEFPLEIFFNTGLRRNSLTSGNVISGFPCVTRVNSTPAIPAVEPLAGGRLMVTGGCTNPANGLRYQLARFNADSSFDTTFNRLDFASGTVTDIFRQPDGKYILLGNFGTVNGVARRNIVRLRPRTASTSVPDFDFDGDRKADLAVYRPSNGYWYIYNSTGGYTYVPWGLATDKLVAADYDNDGKADFAVFRDGTWYIMRSSDGVYDIRTFGVAGNIPLVGSFTADDPSDDKVDMVLRTAFATSGSGVQWQFRAFGLPNGTSGAAVPGETPADKSVVADLDGDGIDEYGFFRDGVWKTLARGGTTVRQFTWGLAGDIPVPADYDGDGQADYAIFRPSTGVWWINGTTIGVSAIRFGISTDIPVPADYDGDGRTDIAIYRDGQWWQLLSSTSAVRVGNWGTAGDIPIPAQSRF